MFVPKDRFYTAVMQGVHDSMERERKRTRQAMHTVVAALAIIVLIGSICFGWMGVRASLRTHELVRVSTCQQAVIDMKSLQTCFEMPEAFKKAIEAYTKKENL